MSEVSQEEKIKIQLQTVVDILEGAMKLAELEGSQVVSCDKIYYSFKNVAKTLINDPAVPSSQKMTANLLLDMM